MYKFYLSLFIIIAACQSVPSKNYIPNDKMAEILADLYYLDAAFEPLSLHVRDSIIQSNRWKILEKHQVTDSDFIQTSIYYKNQKTELDKIELRVKELLKLKAGRKDSLDAGLN